MFTEKQEAVFDIFDNLIDDDIDVYMEIQANESLRKRIGRSFDSIDGMSKVKTSLKLYGISNEELTYEIPAEELRRVWEASNDGVHINDYQVDWLSSLANKERSEVIRLAGEFKEEAKEELLGIVCRDVDPDVITNYFFKHNTKGLRGFVEKTFGSFEEFRELLNIPDDLVYYDKGRFIGLGFEFEKLVGDHLFHDYERQARFGNCRPDFSKEGVWVDAKLSISTSFQYDCETIKKYTRRVDNLVIIYAVKDWEVPKSFTGKSKTTFKHISEFYKDLPDEVVTKFKRFVSRANELKGMKCVA